MCPPQGSATWGQAEGDTPCARCPLRHGHIIISIQKAKAPGAKSSLELALFLRSLPMPGPTSFLLFFPHFPNCRSLGVCLSSILCTPLTPQRWVLLAGLALWTLKGRHTRAPLELKADRSPGSPPPHFLALPLTFCSF